MKRDEVKKKLKNVVPNIKLKKDFDSEISIFSFIQIKPKDVYHDADENNTITDTPLVKKKKKFNKQI